MVGTTTFFVVLVVGFFVVVVVVVIVVLVVDVLLVVLTSLGIFSVVVALVELDAVVLVVDDSVPEVSCLVVEVVVMLVASLSPLSQATAVSNKRSANNSASGFFIFLFLLKIKKVCAAEATHTEKRIAPIAATQFYSHSTSMRK